MKKLIALIMAVLMVAVVFAGCGAEETEGSKKWIIATDTVFKPFEYTDKDGNFVGIDVDIMAAVAEDQGFDYELKSLGWDAAIAACQARQANAMIAGASITDERKNSGWIFSDGYYTATQCMTVKADGNIKGFADLKGKKVAVKNGTMGETYAKSLKDQYEFEITVFEDSPTMYQAVIGGQAVACFEDTPIMITSIKDNGYNLRVVEGSENKGADYGVAVFNEENKEFLEIFKKTGHEKNYLYGPCHGLGLIEVEAPWMETISDYDLQENKEFLEIFNEGLKNIKANGKYDAIINKYLG